MAFAIHLDSATGVVIATCSGELKLADGRQGAESVWGRPEWAGRPIVWDFRTARLDVSVADVREFANFVLERQPEPPPPKVAIVTASNHDFGLSRMFEVYREHPATEVRVFRDYDEAVTWARLAETTSA